MPAPTRCFFVSDLHGKLERYHKLFEVVRNERPDAVLVGGDFLPSRLGGTPFSPGEFIRHYLVTELHRLRRDMAGHFPRFFLIMGNDDERAQEPAVHQAEALCLLQYVHQRKVSLAEFDIFGYAYVPPTPFQLKDWERYDVSRYVDPGCISPEEGVYSCPVSDTERKWSTIQNDLQQLAKDAALDRAVFLFHAPPYRTRLDRGGLDQMTVEAVPLDFHLGSIAVRRFIEAGQPLLTLHGHVHESARLSGAWRDQIGRTHLLSAAHDGPELALVRFDLQWPADATRELI